MKFLLFISREAFFEPAVQYTGNLAKKTNASVTVFCFTDDESSLPEQDEFSAILDKFLPQGYEFLVGAGDKVDQVNAALAQEGVDLMIVGARTELSAFQKTLGSHAMEIVEGTSTNVVVVREPHADFKKVLVCTGGKLIADKVVKAGSKIAKAMDASVTLLHIENKIPRMYTGLVEMDETIDTMLEKDTPLADHLRSAADHLAKEGIEANIKLRHGNVVDEILEEIDDFSFDMVVLGASGAQSTLSGWLMGNVTKKIVKEAACPVLVVN